jgi:hypothetical protein
VVDEMSRLDACRGDAPGNFGYNITFIKRISGVGGRDHRMNRVV